MAVLFKSSYVSVDKSVVETSEFAPPSGAPTDLEPPEEKQESFFSGGIASWAALGILAVFLGVLLVQLVGVPSFGSDKTPYEVLQGESMDVIEAAWIGTEPEARVRICAMYRDNPRSVYDHEVGKVFRRVEFADFDAYLSTQC